MRRAFPLSLAVLGAMACADPSIMATPTASPSANASALPSASASPSASAAPSSAPAASEASVPAVPDAAIDAPLPAPRVYVRAHSLGIHADASPKSALLGTLASGESVPLRDDPPRSVAGCAIARAIEPRGWVCIDGGVATLDANDAVWMALQEHAGDFTSPLPYTYGESKGTRRQRTLPDVTGTAWPPLVFDPRLEIAPRSTVAWTSEVESGGVSWVRANDQSFVRKDQIVPYARTEFHGIELGTDVTLPVAFFKRVAHTQYRRDANGRFAPTGETWPRLSWVALSGKTEKRSGRTFWETKTGDLWLDARDAAVIAPTEPPPSGHHTTWIEVAALAGWLVAYEGDKPAYATLISAGKLGAMKPDPTATPHQSAATTPIGTYRVREKLLTTTLQSELDDGVDFIHGEVPWSQRFLDLYLLHTAYWHDQWGEGHSGGCVNLAPADAKWLFGWTEPRLPEGWHSMRIGEREPSTAIVIHP